MSPFIQKDVYKRQVFVTQEAWIGDPGNIAVAAQKLGHSLGIFAMPLHPHMKALQAKIQEKRMLGGLNTAEITHQLRRSLGDKGPFLSEFFGVGNTVIALIRRAQAWKFVGMGHPVKAAAVYNGCLLYTSYLKEGSAMDVIDRFFSYVSFDTQSDENSTSCPSTEKEMRLAEALVQELQSLGPVSYTHLDVYKRQVYGWRGS